MMSALGELGRTGLTAVSNSHEEARATYAEAVAVLDQEARAESIQRPAFAQIRRGRRNPNDEARITNESRARFFSDLVLPSSLAIRAARTGFKSRSGFVLLLTLVIGS